MKIRFGVSIAVLGSILCATPPAQAQLTIGVAGGIVSSTLTGSDAQAASVESETGVLLGAWVTLPLASRLSVAPGVHYIQKGAAVSEQGISGKVETDYIEIPILLNVELTPPESAVSFTVFGGPSVAFEIACTASATVSGVSASADCGPADQDDRQTLDLGAILGGGVRFPMTDAIGLLLSAGVDFGLRRLDTSSTNPTDEKLRAIFGSVGATFAVGS